MSYGPHDNATQEPGGGPSQDARDRAGDEIYERVQERLRAEVDAIRDRTRTELEQRHHWERLGHAILIALEGLQADPTVPEYYRDSHTLREYRREIRRLLGIVIDEDVKRAVAEGEKIGNQG